MGAGLLGGRPHGRADAGTGERPHMQHCVQPLRSPVHRNIERTLSPKASLARTSGLGKQGETCRAQDARWTGMHAMFGAELRGLPAAFAIRAMGWESAPPEDGLIVQLGTVFGTKVRSS